MSFFTSFQSSKCTCKRKALSSRRLKFESLEPKILLAYSRGISSVEFEAIKDQFPGFNYANISYSSVLVVGESDISLDSLKSAITAAKNTSGPDLILIKPGATKNRITFSAANMLTIDDSSSLTIIAYGTNGQGLTIDASNKSRIFEIKSTSTIQLANMTLTNGNAGSASGGAILNAGKLSLDRMIISNSKANHGGGIYCSSTLTMTNSLVCDNTSYTNDCNGGGLYLTGKSPTKQNVHSVINCTIVNNRAGNQGRGGGIYFKGQDANQDVIAGMEVYNSIIVCNTSGQSSGNSNFDQNIYNESCRGVLEDVSYEDGRLGPLVGFHNLSTFEYWADMLDDESETTNILYNTNLRLFTDLQGKDYTLYDWASSQAINRGDRAYAKYPGNNKKDICYDLAGNDRIQDSEVDIGAYELPPPYIDLKTENGGLLTSSQIVHGGLFGITGINVTNTNTKVDAGSFKIRLYASLDQTIELSDTFLGELDVSSIAAGKTLSFDMNPLSSASLDPANSYYLGWMIDLDMDNNPDNDSAYCPTPLRFLPEENTATIQLNEDSYRVKRGCEFHLAADYQGENLSWWWDYGTGYYTEGVQDDWISYNKYSSTDGDKTIRLKVVHDNRVIGTAQAPLTITETLPSLETRIIHFSNERVVKLNLNYTSYMRTSAKTWTVDWGDDEGETQISYMSNSISLAHYYSGTQSYAIKVRVVDSADNGAWFAVGSFNSSNRSNSGIISDFQMALADEVPDMPVPEPAYAIDSGIDRIVILDDRSCVPSRNEYELRSSRSNELTVASYDEGQHFVPLAPDNSRFPDAVPIDEIVLEEMNDWHDMSDDYDFLDKRRFDHYGVMISALVAVEL